MTTPNQPEGTESAPQPEQPAGAAQSTPAPAAPSSTSTYGKGGKVAAASKDGTRTNGMRNRWDNANPQARKKLLIACIAALATLMVGLLVLLFLRGNDAGKIANDTKVAGVDLGGKTEQQATDELSKTLLAQSKQPLTVTVDQRTQTITAEQAGLSLDIAATVKQALEAGGGFRLGTTVVKPVVVVNEKKLTAATKQLAQTFDREVVEGGISYNGIKPVLKNPQTGIELDVAQAKEAIRNGYMAVDDQGNLREEPITLPAKVTKPTISADEVVRASNELAVPAVSAPVSFRDGSRQTSLAPRDYVEALGFEAGEDNTLHLSVSGSILAQKLAPRLGGSGQQPVNATFTIQSGRPVLVPGKPGVAIDENALATAMAAAVVHTDPAQRVVEVSRTEQQPKVTTEALQQLGIKEQVSSFDQHYEPATYRIHNLKQAASSVNGTIVKPGETFSLNQTLGQRTLANGYVEGGVISNGEFSKDVGGGVSTMATTMWTAAFYGGLERVQQRAHSLYIKRYQAGLEATVNWGTLDMKWKNDTDTAIFITSHAENTYVNVTFWGTKHYDVKAQFGPRRNIVQPAVIHKPATPAPTPGGDEAKVCTPQQGVEGFDITVTRVLTPLAGNAAKGPDTWSTHYDPTPQIICDQSGQGSAGSGNGSNRDNGDSRDSSEGSDLPGLPIPTDPTDTRQWPGGDVNQWLSPGKPGQQGKSRG